MDKPKILIAEDEEDLRELYKTRFEYESFGVILAQDGEEAIEKTTKEKPDLILLDLMMPKKGGIEALKELKENPETSKIPVIVLTALFEENIKKKVLEMGADYFLTKADILASDVVNLVKRLIVK